MAPVEGFFLQAASIKAQKIVKGIRRNGTSSIPEYSIKKAIHETWKRLKGSVMSVFDRHSHKLILVLVRRVLSWSFDPFSFLFFL